MTRYMQTRVSDDEYKKIKKKAIDLGIDVEILIKQAVLQKITEEEERESASQITIK